MTRRHVGEESTRTPAIDVLRRTDLFGSLPDDDLSELAGASRTRTFRRGQYLWYQGDPGDTLLVVCDGRLKIVFGFEPTGVRYMMRFFVADRIQ